MSEETLFHEALAKAPAERAAFLDAACAGQPELRAAVEALMAAHVASASLLNQPAADPNVTGAYTPLPVESTGEHVPQDAQPGYVIAGRYTLEQKLGEGGMGEVWVAKQTEPVKRKVALKLIKAGMDSKAVIQRFEQERQALALMDHPHIAKVLDGGLTQDRHPFFVMELVNGLPLSKFCDEAKLTPKERLELFLPICQAVQHAHQKGIIHRDLKPSNILVTLIDGKPVPKVIDFGVAKATAGKLTDESLSTNFGAVVGTLEYMSPEQAGYSGEDIDTRADIYSLGVILYEMLTGLRPIDAKRFHKAALTEMIRIIREEEPSKPSTRLSTDEALPSLAAVRQTEPKKLMAMLRGELDWVVMKCLEKQRDRRYETANGLARDIQRHLADEPVEARPPSFGYRAGKFLRRHKGSVAAASLVALALVGGIIGTSIGLFRATEAAEGERRAKVDAEIQKVKALEAAAAEKIANEQAQKRLRQLEKANDLLGSVFEKLDPKEVAQADRPLQAILVEKLDQAVAQLEGETIGDPLVVINLQNKLGLSLLGLGAPKKAVVLFERAYATCKEKYGPDHPATLMSMYYLASGYHDTESLERVIPLYLEVLKRTQAIHGPDHPSTLTIMNGLALAYQDIGRFDLALPLLEETLRLRKLRLGLDHPYTRDSMANLALGYVAVGKLERALPLQEEVLKLTKAKFGNDHPDTLNATHSLALSYHRAGRQVQGLRLLEETLQKIRMVLGPDHSRTLNCMNSLATVYSETWQLDRALPLLEEGLKRAKAKHGPDHPNTITRMNNLANGYQQAGQWNLALPLAEESLKLARAKWGLDHPHTLTSMHNLAVAYENVGKLELAIPLQEETLKRKRDKLGPDHPSTLTSMHSLAVTYRNAGQVERAVSLSEETLQRSQAKLGPHHPSTLRIRDDLALGYLATGKVALAASFMEETFQLTKDRFGADHIETLDAMHSLAKGYRAAGRLERALPLYEESLEKAKIKLGLDHPATLTRMNDLALAYASNKQFDKSIPLFEEALQRQEVKLGRSHPKTLMTVANLGATYKDAGRLKEAMPLLEEGFAAGSKQPGLRYVGLRLLDGYVQLGKGEQAKALAHELVKNARTRFPPGSPQLADRLALLGSSLLQVKAPVEAEPLIRECLALREQKEPDAWTTFNTYSLLGGALLGQKKYAEAEPLLLKGYAGMKQRDKTIPPQGKVRLTEALVRLVQLYEATGKKEEAAKWRTELEAIKAAQAKPESKP